MRRIGVVAVLGLAAVLTAGVSTAQAAKGVKKTEEHRHQGTIVTLEEKLHSGFVVIKTHQHKKKGGAGKASKHEKFAIERNTKVEAVGGGAKQAVGFGALRPGEHVTILAHEHRADLIEIHAGKKK
jgi:hypothetical protein